jgi:hypothetical protein
LKATRRRFGPTTVCDKPISECDDGIPIPKHEDT